LRDEKGHTFSDAAAGLQVFSALTTAMRRARHWMLIDHFEEPPDATISDCSGQKAH